MEATLQYIHEISEAYHWYVAFFLFVFGTCVGSFLNVCVYRFPQELSVVKPRSFCPHCEKQIPWYYNIPLISFLVLKGKCRFCGGKISFRYFLLELIAGILMVLLFFYFGLSVKLFWVSYFVFSLLIVTWVDIKTMEIPDEVSLTGIIVGCLFAFGFPHLMLTESHWISLGKALLGAFAGAAIIWVTAVIGDYVFKKESMGGGDLKLLAMVGAFLGLRDVVLTFFIAPFFALPFGLYLKYFRKSEVIAYGPFLAIAAVFSIFFSDWLLNWVFAI